jgi:hypothetical protein
MPIKLANNAVTTIQNSISSSDTGITVAAGTGNKFPSLSNGDYFYATLSDTSGNFEIVRVTSRSGDSMIIVRAQENTAAFAFAANSRVELRVTAQSVLDALSTATNYQGASATNPTTRLDGLPLVAGDFYFNTVDSQVRFYNGTDWVPLATSALKRDGFTGNGVTTSYTLSISPSSKDSTQVYINGVYQEKNGYNVSGTTLTFTVAPPNGSTVEVITIENVGIPSAELVGYQPAGTGAVTTDVQTKLRETVSVKDFGAVGDGVADDTAAIQAAITYAQTTDVVLDFGGKTYAITAFGANPTNRLTLRDGKLVSIDTTDRQFLIRLRTTADLYVENMEFDGNQKAAKLLFVNANDTNCRIVVNNCIFRNALQTDVATSSASGIQVQPEDPGDYFVSAKITNSSFYSITSTRANPLSEALVSVGRGITIFECQDTVITNCDFDEIGPFWDGDGISVSADNSIAGRRENFSMLVSDCWFRDCEKRSIKSQVGRSVVNSIVCERTQAFTFFGGQTEIDLQHGGRINNVICKYADGAAPRDIFGFAAGGSPSQVTMEISNVSIVSENPNDVIINPTAFTLGVDATSVPLVNVSNLTVNCKVQNICRLNTNNQTVDATKWDRVILRNIQVADFDTTNVGHAIIFMSRGPLSFNRANVVTHNISVGSGYAPPFAYLNPAPGATTFLSANYTENFNTLTDNPNNILSSVAPVKTFRFNVAENATFSRQFNLTNPSSAVIVTVTYTSSRDALANKLVTQGIVQSSSARTYYTELIAGRKSSAQTGAISVDESTTDNTFTVSKTAGNTATTGFLLVTLQDIGYAS